MKTQTPYKYSLKEKPDINTYSGKSSFFTSKKEVKRSFFRPSPLQSKLSRKPADEKQKVHSGLQNQHPNAQQNTISSNSRHSLSLQKSKKPKKKFVGGNLVIDKKARKDILKRGGLLPSVDNAHIAIHRGTGVLKYDANYKTPTDPFRWNKIKDIVDSGEKVLIKFVQLTDTVSFKAVSPKGSTILKPMMIHTGAAGLTLPTESKHRSIFPKDKKFVCSPAKDTHIVLYSKALASSAATSSLAHELFGHLWLAIKGVPFVHPKKRVAIATRGTLKKSHGIKDPLGNTFAGKVEKFINDFAGSKTFSMFASPTQFVSPGHLKDAMAKLKKDFPKKATGKYKGAWSVPRDVDLQFLIVSQNYRFAGSSTGKINKASIEKEISTWYKGLNKDKKYVFHRLIDKTRISFDRPSTLASDLFRKLPAP